jgi:transcriptional regulator GlxA family with amidase domain
MRHARRPRRVSIIALPESMGTPIHGLYETLTLVDAVAGNEGGGGARLFDVEVVGPRRGVFPGACGLPLEAHRSLAEVDDTDIVLMASMLLDNQEWIVGSHPETVAWLRQMHRRGADLCSACAGALLLAETGLIDGLEATTHWAFADTFQRNFPNVRLRVEEVLITAGRSGEFVMSGAASSWQDLILYLIARHASPTAAQAVGRFLLYQWHADAQAPYLSFAPSPAHGDAIIRDLQAWLQQHYALARPVEEMARRSGLATSSFKRRFKRATGYSPLEYVQHVRVEEAKKRLERTEDPIDEICCAVGYEEPPFFRRLFRRVTRLTPGEYRRKFRVPAATEARRPNGVPQGRRVSA